MSTVTATYTDAQGNPASGTVYLSPAARAGIGQPPDIVTEKRVWADLDEQGRISINVIPSDDPGWLIDGQMPYLVEERLMGLPFRSYWIGVPDAGLDLSAVQHADPDVAPMPVPGPQGPPGIQGPEGPQGPPGEDFTPADADARYVNATGDTMTGTLIQTAPDAYHRNDGDVQQYIERADGTDLIRWRYYQATGLLRLTAYANRAGASATANVLDVTAANVVDMSKASGVTVPVPSAATHVPRLARTPNAATGDLGLPGYAGSDTGARSYNSGVLRRTGNVVTYTGTGTPPTGFRDSETTGERTYITRDTWPTSLPGTQVTPPATWT